MQQGLVAFSTTRPPRAPAPVGAPTLDALVAAMPLDTLAQHCRRESAQFFKSATHDPRYAYELFRRAIVLRDDAAWAALYDLYHALVQGWVRRSSSFVASGESCEYFVNAAFTRFWRAIPPERFAAFTSVNSLLNYLHHCARCTVIDSARTQMTADLLPDEPDEELTASEESVEDDVIDQIERRSFWSCVDGLLRSEAERVVIYQSFVLGLRPRDILARYPQLFATINDVYLVKRYVLERLSRSDDVRQMLENA